MKTIFHEGSVCEYLEQCLDEGCICQESPICRYEHQVCYIYQHRKELEAEEKSYNEFD